MAEIVKAKRKRVKLKLGISAPSGAGKTIGALIIAYGILKEKYPDISDEELWNKVLVLDTENESASLYAEDARCGINIGSFNTINLEPPFSPTEYIDGINSAQDYGIEILIIDSLSQAWAGSGGILEKQANIAKKTSNGYTAWREITPLHNKLVDAILQCDMHVIATIRSKVEYVVDKDDNGKTSIKKLGLAPIQREGMEYEFTTFFDIEKNHECSVSKDRTSIFDETMFTITPEVGKKFTKWLEKGIIVLPIDKKEIPKVSMEDLKLEIAEALSAITDRTQLKIIIEGEKIPINYNIITDIEILRKYLYIVKDSKNS